MWIEKLDRLIESYREEARWFISEARFIDDPDKASYQDQAATFRRVVTDLENLRKSYDEKGEEGATPPHTS